MKKIVGFILCVSLLFFTELNAQKRVAKSPKMTIEKSDISFKILKEGSQSGKKVAENVIVNSIEKYKYEEALTQRENTTQASMIDFKKTTILALYFGEYTSGSFDGKVTRVTTQKGKILVEISVPKKNRFDPQIMMISQPYIFLSIEKTGVKSIEIRYKTI